LMVVGVTPEPRAVEGWNEPEDEPDPPPELEPAAPDDFEELLQPAITITALKSNATIGRRT
jgi:hypothetical protein